MNKPHGGCLTCGWDAGALLGTQWGLHSPAARRLDVELPVVVVPVAPQPGSSQGGQVGGGSHSPGIVSAVVAAAGPVERLPPVQAGGEHQGLLLLLLLLRRDQHRVLAPRSGRQDAVDAEHPGRHSQASLGGA